MSLHNISPDTRLFIVQADDAGLLQSVNQSIIGAFERKVTHSVSIMAPCPFFDEIAANNIQLTSWKEIGENI